jgi:hypothetical protein
MTYISTAENAGTKSLSVGSNPTTGLQLFGKPPFGTSNDSRFIQYCKMVSQQRWEDYIDPGNICWHQNTLTNILDNDDDQT